MKNKINVNISPNPLDLQTLHCSQNDTSERKFYFTLHNNGEVIDTSDISDPIFEPFSVYKGGTEQLLPINTDDPTTSPIIADIQYPDEEKTEQEFTCRESPTTIDGKALVEKLKGNTLTWNQLAQNGNFADTSGWTASGGTLTASDNKATFTVTANDNNIRISRTLGTGAGDYVVQVGHIYLATVTLTSPKAITPRMGFYGDNVLPLFWFSQITANTRTVCSTIRKITNTATTNRTMYLYFNLGQTKLVIDDEIVIENIELFDLTKMFGEAKAEEILAMQTAQSGSGVAYFRSLFPLNYYSYGQKLLPFKGEGIKTVGKNLLPEAFYDGVGFGYNSAVGTQFTATTDTTVVKSGSSFSKTVGNWGGFAFISDRLFEGQEYTANLKVSAPSLRSTTYMVDSNLVVTRNLGNVSSATEITRNFTVQSGEAYFVGVVASSTAGTLTITDPIVSVRSEFTNYEPYTSSTTSIPTSTYFPNGMMGWGTAFDELTNSKAIHRMNEVDLGTQTWGYNSGNGCMFSTGIQSLVKIVGGSEYANIVCPLYDTKTYFQIISATEGISISVDGTIYVYDSRYTDATTFKNAMNGVMLQFELEEEQTTEFTQASLICEDGESTLYQDAYGLVCDCTEDFSKDSGFKDCKIKFTNDDGVVYSNKIQLHIERKP